MSDAGTFRVGLAFDANGPFVRIELRDAKNEVAGVVNLHDFGGAMTLASDVMDVIERAWPAAYRQLAGASAGPAVVAVIAIPAKSGGGTVPCMKGHLHASPEAARACEADSKIPPMVGADFVGPLKH